MRRLLQRLLAWFWQRKSRLLDLVGYGVVLAGVAMWSRPLAVILSGGVLLLAAFVIRREEQAPAAPTKPETP